jgi:hypothetical protein
MSAVVVVTFFPGSVVAGMAAEGKAMSVRLQSKTGTDDFNIVLIYE